MAARPPGSSGHPWALQPPGSARCASRCLQLEPLRAVDAASGSEDDPVSPPAAQRAAQPVPTRRGRARRKAAAPTAAPSSASPRFVPARASAAMAAIAAAAAEAPTALVPAESSQPPSPAAPVGLAALPISALQVGGAGQAEQRWQAGVGACERPTATCLLGALVRGPSLQTFAGSHMPATSSD